MSQQNNHFGHNSPRYSAAGRAAAARAAANLAAQARLDNSNGVAEPNDDPDDEDYVEGGYGQEENHNHFERALEQLADQAFPGDAPRAPEGPPPDEHPAEEPQADPEEGDPQAPAAAADEDFPGWWMCPISTEPPTWPVLFNIPNEDGTTYSNQVFEYVDIFKNIATRTVHCPYHVKHPINGQFVKRHEAIHLLQDVDVPTARRIAEERARQGLPSEIKTVSEQLSNRMAATVAFVSDQ